MRPIMLSSANINVSYKWKNISYITYNVKMMREVWVSFGERFGDRNRTVYINKFLEAFKIDEKLMKDFVKYLHNNEIVYTGYTEKDLKNEFGNDAKLYEVDAEPSQLPYDFVTTIRVDETLYGRFLSELKFVFYRETGYEDLSGSTCQGSNPAISWIIRYMYDNTPTVQMVIPNIAE